VLFWGANCGATTVDEAFTIACSTLEAEPMPDVLSAHADGSDPFVKGRVPIVNAPEAVPLVKITVAITDTALPTFVYCADGVPALLPVPCVTQIPALVQVPSS
jgi:hypothetical protein